MKVCSLTDVGVKREINQDYFYSSDDPVGKLPNLFIVADGMGGHNAGEFASRYAVETMVDTAIKMNKREAIGVLLNSISAANGAVRDYAQAHSEMKGMGTTVVACVIDGENLVTANVGDSRLYIVRDEMIQVTKDHSLVQEMVRMGEMDKEKAKNHPDKNIITRAVGVDRNVQADIFESTLEPGDMILLCSDGLTNMVEEEEILDILHGSDDLTSKIEYLVELANKNGGKDNITVIVIDPELER